MDLELQGEIALVTGAGQGVGRAIARRLATEGAAVIINDLFAERCEAVCEEIKAEGGTALAIAADITDLGAVYKMVETARGELGQVSILVNNAGMPIGDAGAMFMSNFADTRPADWQKLVNLNLYGSMHCCHAVIPAMREARHGRIISIISEAGRVGEPKMAVYSAAKGGLLAFTRALAKELGGQTITVNAVALGNIDAEENTLDKLPEARQKAASRYALARGLNRMAYPTDIADAVAFLASARASYITGVSLSVSGGYSIG